MLCLARLERSGNRTAFGPLARPITLHFGAPSPRNKTLILIRLYHS